MQTTDHKKLKLVVSIALINQEEKVLITKRPSKKHLSGYWEFPGGKVEENETAEEKCEDLKERKSKAMRRSMNPVNENNSTRLHKLEEELEKMLQ